MKPEAVVKEERVYLGTVRVDLGKIYLFGQKERLHEMVSFIPGLGNGVYEVYGHYKDIPGYGIRIAKVEIECITPEEIHFYAKEYSDFVMEGIN